MKKTKLIKIKPIKSFKLTKFSGRQMGMMIKPITHRPRKPSYNKKILLYNKTDTDGDGIPDYRDCVPLNPHKHSIDQTSKKNKPSNIRTTNNKQFIIRNPKQSEMPQLRKLLAKCGDDLPSDKIRIITGPKYIKSWLIIVDKNGKIYGGGQTYQKDWYEWVVSSGFVVPEARGSGIASQLWAKLTDKAEVEGASVAEADITSSNISSKIAASRAGMRAVNSFKWSKKADPADVYQEVFIPTTQKQINKVNNDMIKKRESMGKKMIPHTMSIRSRT